MPRDITILSPHVVDVLDLATAARAVDESLGVREIDGGAALQVFGGSGDAVLTVFGSEEITVAGEIERLLPDPPGVRLPVHWVDAVAPHGADGERGVSVALRLALGLEATCIVEDD
ncbi:hypothetical protein ES689_01775 [Frigoribacterium sp. ACAM 257]|uniref:hypothetical protein n=1 Tax=Frigoribacterium sp. ACAM 257 TaxID=2508998 RepID=UPI0011B9D5EC|nr:hypothetical protein [Frigoribacterium sp. ACAM 257]TWX40223.1 hypothetical protein ES689_01775 [Frigoribacterium sp. ACAM 257]